MRNLRLDQLQTFAEVVKFGNFSKAAVALNLSQPAVSLQIRQLEERLGCQLLQRDRRSVQVTNVGQELLRQITRLDDTISEVLRAIESRKSGHTERIRIAASATVCIYLLPAVLGPFRRKNRSIEISVMTADGATITKAIDEQIVDLGIVTLPVAGRTIEIEPLLNDPLIGISPARGSLLPAVISPSILRNQPLLAYDAGGNTRAIVDEWFAQERILINPVMKFNSTEVIKGMVAAGLGCAILPALSLSRRGIGLKQHRLSPALGRELAIITRRHRSHSEGMALLLDAIREVRERPAARVP